MSKGGGGGGGGRRFRSEKAWLGRKTVSVCVHL